MELTKRRKRMRIRTQKMKMMGNTLVKESRGARIDWFNLAKGSQKVALWQVFNNLNCNSNKWSTIMGSNWGKSAMLVWERVFKAQVQASFKTIVIKHITKKITKMISGMNWTFRLKQTKMQTINQYPNHKTAQELKCNLWIKPKIITTSTNQDMQLITNNKTDKSLKAQIQEVNS